MANLINTNDLKTVLNDLKTRFSTKSEVSSKANIIAGSEAEYADLVFYDKANDKKIIVKVSDWSLDKYPADSYTPIGVVAIPSSHDVYGDSSCGVISLKYMNNDVPDSGTDYGQIITWGEYYSNTSLTDYTQIPYFGSTANQTTERNISTADGYLPSDNWSTIQSIVDPLAYYKFADNREAIQSPYLEDGSRNVNYYASDIANPFSDFDGIGNTKVLLSLATAEDWKTLDTISNIGDTEGYHAAAECCWRFHTDGTSQGDWYLPSAGELGYVFVRFKAIGASVQLLYDSYEPTEEMVWNDNYYWSSTEYNSQYAYVIDKSGTVHKHEKYNTACVRAFTRITTSKSQDLSDVKSELETKLSALEARIAALEGISEN